MDELDEMERIEVPRRSLERLRNALAHLKLRYPHLTLRAAIERGAELVENECRIYLNAGEPFPPREGRVPSTRFAEGPAVRLKPVPAEEE